MHQDPPGRELQLFNLARDPTEQVGKLNIISIDCAGTAGGPGRQEAGRAGQAAAAGGPPGAGGPAQLPTQQTQPGIPALPGTALHSAQDRPGVAGGAAAAGLVQPRLVGDTLETE